MAISWPKRGAECFVAFLKRQPLRPYRFYVVGAFSAGFVPLLRHFLPPRTCVPFRAPPRRLRFITALFFRPAPFAFTPHVLEQCLSFALRLFLGRTHRGEGVRRDRDRLTGRQALYALGYALANKLLRARTHDLVTGICADALCRHSASRLALIRIANFSRARRRDCQERQKRERDARDTIREIESLWMFHAALLSIPVEN
ncbi:MAG: hypothetical protein OXF79_27315 [Chloroflexi bacterium]|nr:hypothetical protein [Chloroflexota bacterium]